MNYVYVCIMYCSLSSFCSHDIEHYVRRNPDLTVTVCRDFIKSSGCPREQCRYFHPPPHISAQLETAASSWPAGLVTPQVCYNSLYYYSLWGVLTYACTVCTTVRYPVLLITFFFFAF